MNPMTPKQWHRYYVRKTAEYIKEREVRGCFVECGVKQGSSSVIMAQVLNTDGYLFDTWHGFPHFSKVDAPSEGKKRKLQKRVKTGKNTYRDCINNLTKNEVIDKCKMVRGDICITIPSFVENHRDDNLSISMLHIDTDLYEPASMSLDQLWEFISPQGLVFFHDYGDKKWPGIKMIVDRYVDNYKDLLFVFNTKNLYACVLFKGRDNSLKEFEAFVQGDFLVV